MGDTNNNEGAKTGASVEVLAAITAALIATESPAHPKQDAPSEPQPGTTLIGTLSVASQHLYALLMALEEKNERLMMGSVFGQILSGQKGPSNDVEHEQLHVDLSAVAEALIEKVKEDLNFDITEARVQVLSDWRLTAISKRTRERRVHLGELPPEIAEAILKAMGIKQEGAASEEFFSRLLGGRKAESRGRPTIEIDIKIRASL